MMRVCLLTLLVSDAVHGDGVRSPAAPGLGKIPHSRPHLPSFTRHAKSRSDAGYYPECDCSCCVTEECPCKGASCSQELLCLTHKGPSCFSWAGSNMEASVCDVARLREAWEA